MHVLDQSVVNMRADVSTQPIHLQSNLNELLEHVCECFADRFHEMLREAFPELEPIFAQVNLQRQAAILTMSLKVVVQNYRRWRIGKKHAEVCLDANE